MSAQVMASSLTERVSCITERHGLARDVSASIWFLAREYLSIRVSIYNLNLRYLLLTYTITLAAPNVKGLSLRSTRIAHQDNSGNYFQINEQIEKSKLLWAGCFTYLC